MALTTEERTYLAVAISNQSIADGIADQIDQGSDAITEPLTGFVAGSGTVTAADTILTAFNKTAGNVVALQGAAGVFSTTLASANIIVGNGSNVATAVAMTGQASINNAGLVTVPAANGTLDVVTAANTETLSSATAVSISKLNTNLSNGTGGTFAVTLAAPSGSGQIKIIQLTVATTHGFTMAATNIGAGTGTATFATVGDCLVLISAGGKWQKIGGTAVIA